MKYKYLLVLLSGDDKPFKDGAEGRYMAIKIDDLKSPLVVADSWWQNHVLKWIRKESQDDTK